MKPWHRPIGNTFKIEALYAFTHASIYAQARKTCPKSPLTPLFAYFVVGIGTLNP